ncbi:MAG: type II toxin-antitoxin system RelE/ParE family toxin [Caulobacteraceae bacterium]
MSYRTTLRADADIIDIAAQSAARYGVKHSHNYVEGLAATFALLAENPRIARERLEFHPPVRMHPYRAHMIVYSESRGGEGILIVRVLHAREDWQRHLG